MVEVLDKISKLKSVCAQETELLELKSELATPLLEDVQYIPMLAEWFCDLSNIGVELREIATRQKNEYLFIILLLYSPMTLAGEKLVNGLRNILAEMFGYKSPSGISNLLAGDMVFQYKCDKELRADVDRIYVEIIRRLQERKIISQDYIL